MINCEHGIENKIIDKISTITGVVESVRTTGPYDIVVMIESNTVESMKNIIEKDIRKIPGVKSTTTLVIARRY